MITKNVCFVKGIRDEEALKAYIKWTTPLAYGNDGRLQFVSPSSTPEECPHVDVVGTVFRELPFS